MNLSKTQTKRMLTGFLAGVGILVGGQAQAAGKMVDVVSVLASGSEVAHCVIISPADNRVQVETGSCSDVIISPADNASAPGTDVIISPADNRSTETNSVLISPADNKAGCHFPQIIIGPVDNTSGNQTPTVIISPADNKQNCPSNGVIISPADNANGPMDGGVIISPADNRTSMTFVSDMNGMSFVAGSGLSTASFGDVDTLKAEAVVAMLEAGARPSSIKLAGVAKAVAGMTMSEDNVLLFAQASRSALALKASGSCTSGDSLATALCQSLR